MLKSKYLLALVPALLLSVSACSNMHGSCSSNMTTANQSSQYVDDSAITAKVKSKLMASQYVNSTNISVSTTDGVVTLSGKVPTMKQKKKAMKLAYKVAGVKAVNNQLMVGR